MRSLNSYIGRVTPGPRIAAHVLRTPPMCCTVYLKILEGTAQYNAKATFKTWLYAVIRNTAVDAHRRARRKRLRLVQPEASFDAIAPSNHLDDQMDQRHLQTLFRQALADLSERQREVMLLVMYHDLTLDEAARVMGVSLGSARTHYDRGKKRLRQWMETTGVFDASR